MSAVFCQPDEPLVELLRWKWRQVAELRGKREAEKRTDLLRPSTDGEVPQRITQ